MCVQGLDGNTLNGSISSAYAESLSIIDLAADSEMKVRPHCRWDSPSAVFHVSVSGLFPFICFEAIFVHFSGNFPPVAVAKHLRREQREPAARSIAGAHTAELLYGLKGRDET